MKRRPGGSTSGEVPTGRLSGADVNQPQPAARYALPGSVIAPPGR